ncbi:MAG: SUMF1/EgtB/PvdO family nonheme iron enzyme, partial [Candidatus Cloacimonetes bacterium]|nr:SUMF1/EgtB/PvdO family nonheme iron enzyme [Candidatus Cloacimonadota bacterium]
MKRLVTIVVLMLVIVSANAARKALLIGNSAYSEKRLDNPVNDARALDTKLRELGFITTLKTDLDKEQFESTVDSFSRSLSMNDEAVFYYAGHGVQVDNVNYLVPLKANIEEEYQCPYRAVNANYILDALTKSKVSIIILDACRNNPYSWRRSGIRGLAPVDVEFGGQLVIFSTAAGSEAKDGDGKNSPFAASLINHISTPNLDLDNLIRSVGEDLSKYKQTPAIYGFLSKQYFFARSEASQPQERKAAQPAIQVESTILTGTLEVESNTAGDLYLDGNHICSIGKSEIKTLRNVAVGSHELELRYDGKSQKQSVNVLRDQSSKYAFNVSQTVSAPPIMVYTVSAPANMVYVEGGSFQMGSNDGGSDEKPVHLVTMSSFFIGKTEVTQKEWQEVMGSNPSYSKGDNLPVENISWYDALVYCNKRSIKEGLMPAYSIGGNTNPSNWSSGTISCDWNASGYRLPTEAEWEYAARGGNRSKGF